LLKVLIVDIDSLRPDHLGCYGYGRHTSPNIDALAQTSTIFHNCFASDTPCLPSRTALAMGRFGIKNGVNTHWGHGQHLRPIANGHAYQPGCIPTFALLGQTMRTASISSFAERHKAFWFSAAFRESNNPPSFRTGLETADDVTPVALEWLRRHAQEQDWLLHVNYWDVHHPYPVSQDNATQIAATGPASIWPTDEHIRQHHALNGVRTAAQWFAPELEADNQRREQTEPRYRHYPMPRTIGDRKQFDYIVAGYDASIAVVDQHVQRLVEYLQHIGVYDETIIVITADHGEAFGEHGIYAEHAFAHPPCQHIPLIVKWPEGTPSRCDELVYQFDVMATLTEAAGLPVPMGWDAQSFLPALEGRSYPGRRYLVCTHGIYTFSRSVVRRDWVYIRTIHPGLYDIPPEMLHDRHTDPFYVENVLDQRSTIRQELAASMNDWWHATAGASGASDPLLDTLALGPFEYGGWEPYAQQLRVQGARAKLQRLHDHLASFGIDVLL